MTIIPYGELMDVGGWASAQKKCNVFTSKSTAASARIDDKFVRVHGISISRAVIDALPMNKGSVIFYPHSYATAVEWVAVVRFDTALDAVQGPLDLYWCRRMHVLQSQEDLAAISEPPGFLTLEQAARNLSQSLCAKTAAPEAQAESVGQPAANKGKRA